MERIEPARFAAEVSQRFEFLIDRCGMDGPESSDLLTVPSLPGAGIWCDPASRPAPEEHGRFR